MTAVQISFFVLAVASTASSIGVIAFKNAVYSALSLILTLLFLAMFYLQLGALFIAVVQILIYAGAIMVLFLFVVTMLAPDQGDIERDRIPWQRFVGIVLALVLVGALSYLLFFNGNTGTGIAAQGGSLSQAIANPHIGGGNVEAFGEALFHGFLFPFEVTSLLIVVAILGALVFGRRA
jgi:NADH-quinone oxidoreductase subunit J